MVHWAIRETAPNPQGQWGICPGTSESTGANISFCPGTFWPRISLIVFGDSRLSGTPNVMHKLRSALCKWRLMAHAAPTGPKAGLSAKPSIWTWSLD